MKQKLTDSELISLYIQNKMDNRERYLFEKRALEDPFLSDAIDGYQLSNEDPIKASQSIYEEIRKKETMDYIETDFKREIRKKVYNRRIFQTMAVAASILFVAISGWYFFSNNTHSNKIKISTILTEKNLLSKNRSDNNLKQSSISSNENADTVNVQPASHYMDHIKRFRKPATIKQAKTDSFIDPPGDSEKSDQITFDTTQSKLYASSPVLNKSLKNKQLLKRDILGSAFSPTPSKRLPENYSLSPRAVIKTEKHGSEKHAPEIKESQAEKNIISASENQLTGKTAGVSIKSDTLFSVLDASRSVAPKKIRTEHMIDSSSGSLPDFRNKSLSEVVVVGYGSIAKTSYPLIGWEKYRMILNANHKSPDGSDGKVIIQFLVGKDGKPYNFKIKKGLSKTCDRLAIKMIKNGSSWVRSISFPENPVILEVPFNNRE